MDEVILDHFKRADKFTDDAMTDVSDLITLCREVGLKGLEDKLGGTLSTLNNVRVHINHIKNNASIKE